ncbi:hypothetical protein AB0L13_41420 [Saccharopolyspora shandongensis]|uniref:hypothetical protein n=1 Tax=Saccharopolyspora shandongensis TaxID=418495 RepID=UPI0034239A3F
MTDIAPRPVPELIARAGTRAGEGIHGVIGYVEHAARMYLESHRRGAVGMGPVRGTPLACRSRRHPVITNGEDQNR